MIDRKQRGPEKKARDHGRAMRLDKEIHNIWEVMPLSMSLRKPGAIRRLCQILRLIPRPILKGRESLFPMMWRWILPKKPFGIVASITITGITVLLVATTTGRTAINVLI